MKKLFKTLFTAMLLFTITANSQITKGNWMVGGDASFNYIKNNPDENPTGSYVNYTKGYFYNIEIKPNIGYFFYDKFAVGTKIEFSIFKDEYSDFQLNSSRFVYGLFARYYFLASENRFNAFVEPSFSTYSNSYSGNAKLYNLKVSSAIFLNSSVAIEPSLNYGTEITKFNTATKIYIGLGLQIHLEKE